MEEKNTYTWVSSDEKVFITEEGRVISTIGLPNNLYMINRPKIDFREIISSKKEIEYFSYYSFNQPKEFKNLSISCKVFKYPPPGFPWLKKPWDWPG